MKVHNGHLTYCTNIHPGEDWSHHFAALKETIPAVKQRISPREPFGIGLRLSHLASLELGEENNLKSFIAWLEQSGCYVFTMNGFPYGGFHHTRVKDQVHAPDWTTQDRVIYTLQLFRLLSAILPKGMQGGISTSPLSYKLWHDKEKSETESVLETATENILKVLEELVRIKSTTGQVMHLDIEPEPDGLLENGAGFIDWYQEYLIPHGTRYLAKVFGYTEEQAANSIREHIQLCYDICHFAVEYEDHKKILDHLKKLNIRVGKIQISAALKAPMGPLPADRQRIIEAFTPFNESTYLHQVVALQQGSTYVRYPDLADALADARNTNTREWRSHFHVPVFIHDFGLLKSTQEDIETVLQLHLKSPIARHLEVETYTWEVLPEPLKLPLQDSIVREMEWVLEILNRK
jgi:sugar phosphate isomerase/epimerase